MSTNPQSYEHEAEYHPRAAVDYHQELPGGDKTIRFGLEENTCIKSEDWNRRWELHGAGRWQLKDIHIFLLKFAPLFRGWSSSSLNNKRILVPLCGKSIDLFWLANQGLQVIGIESSSIAIEELFQQQHVDSHVYTKLGENYGKYTALGEQITIFQMDIFSSELSTELIGGPVDYIWDRAGIVALHWNDHMRYVEKLLTLLKRPKQRSETSTKEEGYDLLFGVYWHSEHRGPPFPLDEQNVAQLFPLSQNYKVDLLDNIDAMYSGWANGGFKEMRELCFGISIILP